MEPIIAPVDRKLIMTELTKEKFIRVTRKGKNFIYEVTAQNSPHTMREIGRLREISFRMGGGGTGKRTCAFCTSISVSLTLRCCAAA